MNSEEAVRAHLDATNSRSGLLVPMGHLPAGASLVG